MIREIPFKKGINLIVDESATKTTQESGNNVGKTTVLRLIDYCLGGNGVNIYKDPEFRDKSNSTIESFLKNKNVVITLCLKESLDNPTSSEILIRRNFLAHSEKLQEINGEFYSNINNFRNELKKLIFKTDSLKPSFKQMIAKNIRDEKNRLQNTVKVLHSTTTQDEYEALYLFWLGINVGDANRKQTLLHEKKIESDLQKRLARDSSPSLVEQSLLVIDRQINELEHKKSAFNVNPRYEEALADLNKIKIEISRKSTSLSRLELRRDLIVESKDELEAEFSDVDIEQLKDIYAEAKTLIPSIQKSFEDTLAFHNSMVLEKFKYITTELPDLNDEIRLEENTIKQLLVLETEAVQVIRNSNIVDDLQVIVKQLNEAHERKGALDEQLRLWHSTLTKSKTIEGELDLINYGIESLDNLIQQRIAIFNEYFSSISTKLYGEAFVLSTAKNDKGYELVISSISGNLGTGKKKGQIAAFDLAYVQFADALGIECLHFILSDQIENVHDNQITSLLNEVVNATNCQYILPVLRDKLPKDIDVNKYTALSLSQNSKLFKI
ncbi:DUF2326 domain-containing protein [Methylotenera sp.]|uniref:DUF2326 domain-containing protein n=1 Tax=Methylotenera sp. TaxID=2051956 RepID=UPI00248A40D2|nr:DUF2326 domain-containing protein [Methylotenera sp.]MDI1298385.1 DUF2326 domain-containing protein [Methylotenera sp.]